MKLSSASVFVSILLASLVSSSPINKHKKMNMGAAKGQAVGAAYCTHPFVLTRVSNFDTFLFHSHHK